MHDGEVTYIFSFKKIQIGALEQEGLAFKSVGISAWLGMRNPGKLTIVEAGEVLLPGLPITMVALSLCILIALIY